MTQSVTTTTLNYGVSTEKVFADVNSVYYGLVNDVYIKPIMINEGVDYENNEYMRSLKKTNEYLNSTVELSNCVESVYLYNENANMIFSNKQNAEIEYFFDKEWLRNYRSDLSKPVAMFINNGNDYLSFVYPYIQYGERTGAIAVNVNITEITSIFQNTNDTYYILDNYGDVIYSNTENSFEFNVETIKQNQSDSGRVAIKTLNGRIFGVYPISGSRYTLVTDMSKSDYATMNILYHVLILLYTLVVFFVVYNLSRRYAQHYYENISEVVEMLSVYDDESDLMKKSDEFEYIKNNISTIISKNLENESQLSKRLIQLKRSKFQALQTQINPHFIFNALNVVNLLLIRNGDLHNEALKMNQTTAKIVKSVLSSDDYLIPVKDEIDFTKDYLEVRLLGKKRSFNVEWNVSEECLKLQTVKFILQPIVENSIEHGFAKCRDRDKLIRIEIAKNGSDIEFVVSDNGIGMSADKLAELHEVLQKGEFPVGKNIALQNVHQRIQLVFGEKYGLTILKSDNLGTTIRINIPVEYAVAF